MLTDRRRLILSGLALPLYPLVIHAALCPATDTYNRDRAAMEDALTRQQAAWNRGDLDAFVEGYWHSSDLTFSGINGTVRGYDGVLERYKKAYANRDAMGQLQFSGLEFRFLGSDAALVLGHWRLTRTKGDIGGVFSLVFQRLPEGWRIIHDHTSTVADAK